MYDNKIKDNQQRTVYTDDLESGEMILIAYFAPAEIFTIDGIAATPAQTYEDMDGLTVFVRRTDKKLFVIGRETRQRSERFEIVEAFAGDIPQATFTEG